mmetsp:Transcript_49256/g.106690  ORF Transcript_49256/g.106690 Transcript_49256/m.106690 type:complete len:438 (-) Transcript_49256:230-1543(-)
MPADSLYLEHPDVTAMSEAEADEWRARHRIRVDLGQPPKPVRSFIEACFPEFITADLEHSGFGNPTAIQSQAWPVVLAGRDMIGLAFTGSGKTLCFALPAIVHINAQEHLQAGDGPIALMLAPTRELALQIKGECDRFGASSGVRNTAVYGGVPKGPQLRDLQHGVEICIATPGRLLDFMDAAQTNLKRCTLLVLDEADRMLDLGFEPQLRRIVAQADASRQTLMWSATWPKEVQGLASELLRDPLMVTVNDASELRVSETIDQRFEVCAEEQKHLRFLSVLQSVNDGRSKVIIFCEKKRGCELLSKDLRRRGFSCETIHGDKSQQERDWVLQQFKQGSVCLLIATDVAGRGLDVKDVRAVINYDAPSQAEDYVHRVGRTGRAGARGVAFSLLTPNNLYFVKDLVAMLQRSGQHVPPDLQRLARMQGSGDAGQRRWR